MKKTILTLLCAISVFSADVFSQAKKPTIMVVPSDVWCNQNGFVTTFDNQGTEVVIPNYKKAFQENSDLLLVISTINGMMAERGFPLKNMESVIKSIESNSAEEAMLYSKETGSTIGESPVDALKKVAKADIIMQLTWTVNVQGPKKSVTFNLQGLDSYTNKQIATATGTGAPSFSSEVPVLLKEAVVSHIDNFNATLMTHFEDLFANGRETSLRIKRWDDWEYDLESYFGEDEYELGEIIEEWLDEETVQGRYSTTDATENFMYFEQVRIPLYYKTSKGKERAMDTRKFASKLSRYLRKEYMIESKVMTKGLGEAIIVLGHK